ncbi:RluA family pseudouridine synthase [Candidatus Gottesmanbacteria bacterium]|nr:RluA family pseudouridine synthase [Candidatus Gottesmanbacteria bacterium]
MQIPILYEDDDLLVVNKPPGIVVNRAESVKVETVQEWVEKKSTNLQIYKSTNENKDFVDRAGIVHRIDKETSGILLIAKIPQAFIDLQRQFKERRIKKTYLAIVHGVLEPKEGEIRAPVGRLPWNRERFGVVPGGKEAVTRYRVIARSEATRQSHDKNEIATPRLAGSRDDISLVELYPETGRTHQIRVHMKYMNHPIVGDYLYAGRKTARSDRTWAPRVMLHAWKLTLFRPSDGSPLPLVAPIPPDMQTIIGRYSGILEEGYASKEKTIPPLA